jgi:hypothetical protein
MGKLDIGLFVRSQHPDEKKKASNYLLGSLAFHAHISGRVRSITDLNDSKARFESRIFGLYFYDLIFNLFTNRSVHLSALY